MTLTFYIGYIFLFAIQQYCNACRNGYVRFEDSCYHLSHDIENWIDAMTYCKVKDGNLAQVESAKENAFLSNLLRTQHVGIAWLGGNDLDVEGYWVWIQSGAVIQYSVWGPGEPNNNGNPAENCLCLQNGIWNDGQCSQLFNYICEMPYDGAEIVG